MESPDSVTHETRSRSRRLLQGFSLRLKLGLPLVVGFLVLTAGMIFANYAGQLETATQQAINQAEAIIAQTLVTRAVYTDQVVGKLTADGVPVTVVTDFTHIDGGIPLPATLTHLISDGVEERGIHQLDLISPWPINPAQGPKTEWQAEALEAMIESPANPQFIVETVEGRSHLVYMSTDFASTDSCVSCHNEHPDSPKNDFQLGDMMGALVVEVSLTEMFARARQEAFRISLGLVIFSIAIVGALVWIQQRTVINPVARLIQASNKFAAGELTAEIEVASSDEVGALALAFQDMASELQKTLSGLEQRVAERTVELEAALRELEAAMDMAAPVAQVWDGILLLPLVGTLDPERVGDILDATLLRITETEALVLIVDISGIPVVDKDVASHLITLTRATRMMGCESIISGISPGIAETIVELGIDIDMLETATTMQKALSSALRRTGMKI